MLVAAVRVLAEVVSVDAGRAFAPLTKTVVPALLTLFEQTAAPELLRAMVGLAVDEDESLAPSDVWSLGCIILRLLTLEPPYAEVGQSAERNGPTARLLAQTSRA